MRCVNTVSVLLRTSDESSLKQAYIRGVHGSTVLGNLNDKSPKMQYKNKFYTQDCTSNIGKTLTYYSSYFELFLPAAIIVFARTVASELLSKTVKRSCKLFSQNFSDTNINFARLSVAEARNY